MRPEIGMTVRIKDTYEVASMRGTIGIIETISREDPNPVYHYAGVKFAPEITEYTSYIYLRLLQYKVDNNASFLA
jgi:hypothetical protein